MGADHKSVSRLNRVSLLLAAHVLWCPALILSSSIHGMVEFAVMIVSGARGVPA